ncbi:MAG: ABC transporter ATP-binding protein [Desulfobulbaceae bacterium]|jgi:putative ABC transport system ATP-binding protein|nr:ABC transporter ATP-binding protein [Desulfobulbaceae bacterium]
MVEPLLVAEHIDKTYRLGKRQIAVLSDVSLAAAAGEFVVISGASGSGKSTLLALLGGLDQPDRGRIAIAGQDITGLSEKRLALVRNRQIGFVFQSFHLVPSLNARENIMFPAELADNPEAAAKAEQLLRQVGLWQRRGNFPSQLSGGECQRVAICRALINAPALIFADEPTGNLDSENAAVVLDLLFEMIQENGATLVMATHSQEVAAQASRLIRLRDGRVVSDSGQ